MPTATPPDITMIICTRDRATQLRKVLGSAVDLQIPPGLKWELLVVDNGSTDETGEVARSYRDKMHIIILEIGFACKMHHILINDWVSRKRSYPIHN